jgi:prefoldin alpha subunit
MKGVVKIRRRVNVRLWSGKPILVPLTTSLYVPGTLADSDNVIVDVGTGFYVEKVGTSTTRRS